MRQIQRFYKTVFAASLVFTLAACQPEAPDAALQTTFKGLDASYHCIKWQEKNRCYYLVKPRTPIRGLLVVLHPAFHNVPELEEMAHLVHITEARGLLALYPEGVDKQWNDGRHAEATRTFNEGTDDVGFLNAIIEKTQKNAGVKKENTSLAGVSNGAMMAMRMACESPAIGRIFTVAGNLPIDVARSCHKIYPGKIVMVFGMQDETVPYRGGKLGLGEYDWGRVVSAEVTESHMANLLGCSGEFQQYRLDKDADDGTIAHKRDFTCSKGRMTSYHVEGMGHTWPGEENYYQALLTGRGTISYELDANQLMVDLALER